MKNLIAFFEIPAVDFKRAVDFYETVLDLQLAVFECEHEKMACFIEDGQTVGGRSACTLPLQQYRGSHPEGSEKRRRCRHPEDQNRGGMRGIFRRVHG